MPIPLPPDLLDGPVIGFGVGYMVICSALAPIWIRSYRLRESKKMIRMFGGVRESIHALPPSLQPEFINSVNVFDNFGFILLDKQPGFKGFLNHGLYKGWREVSQGHSCLRSEATLLRSKLHLIEVDEKVRIKKFVASKLNENKILDREMDAWKQIDILVNQSSLLTGNTGGSEWDRIQRLRSQLLKIHNISGSDEFCSALDVWCTLKEISHILNRMNEEDFADCFDYNVNNAVWEDGVKTNIPNSQTDEIQASISSGSKTNL